MRKWKVSGGYGDESANYDETLEGSCAAGNCGCGCYGRPYIAQGALRHAVLTSGNGWPRPIVDDGALDDRTREALVAFWTEAALAEHASIAGFHRFALALMAHGAPAELVHAAGRAAMQEHEHARACFTLASRYAGREIGAGSMPLGVSAPIASTLAELAAWTVRDGCVGETIAAWVAAEVHAEVTDPHVRAIMRTIAADEEEHAALAWATVRWALDRGGADVRTAVSAAFAQAATDAAPSVPAALAEHGLLPSDRLHLVMRRALVELVRPCARSLLAA